MELNLQIGNRVPVCGGTDSEYRQCQAGYDCNMQTVLPEPKYRLEFVGDSITSREGTVGAIYEEDWISAFSLQ